jgi:hypothetical protein
MGVDCDYHGADLAVPSQIDDLVATTERRSARRIPPSTTQ